MTQITRHAADVVLSAMTLPPPAASADRRGLTFARLSAPGTSGDPLRFVASAEGTNRYGFNLRRSGWRLDNFRRNPVVLWMHDDHRPPIGRADVSMEAEGLIARITFDPADPFAADVERKYRGGFLNALSVGFDFVTADGSPVGDWRGLNPEQINKTAFYDLAEISAVPVPADPRAVRAEHAFAFTAPVLSAPAQRELSEVSRVRARWETCPKCSRQATCWEHAR